MRATQSILLAGAVLKQLLPGLDYGELEAPVKSHYGDSLIRVVRVDPAKLTLKLFSASAEPDRKARSAHDWAAQKGLVAVVNASMYQKDYLTSTALLRTKEHTNNAHASKDKTYLAIGPARALLLDRDCDDVKRQLPRFDQVVQDIRMLSCKGKTVWTQQPGKSWSIAAIGQDGEGRVLLVHSRSPYTVHDFVEHLKALPLNVKRLMYADGGIPSALYVKAGGTEADVVGGYNEANGDTQGVSVATPLPNVLGVVAP
jgi:uncharacterized protein YigE (DUF2233 family)